MKVAGTPSNAPSGQDTGSYDTGAYNTGAYGTNAPPHHGEYDTAGRDATDSYGMGAPYGNEPEYGPGGPEGPAETVSYEPPPVLNDATSPDIPVVRPARSASPRPGGKRLIKFAAVAAAVAVVGGAGAAWAISGASTKPSASGPPRVQQPAPVPLTDAQRKDAEGKRRKELKKRAARAARDEVVRPKLLARGTPPAPTKTPDAGTAGGGLGDPTPVGDAQKIARSMLPQFGWSASSQFGCLVNLWDKESGWNTHASNPSGAYGIPQALPGSKMASAGSDWQNSASTQIKWGLGYIKDRYASPCDAWSHSESTGWY